MAGLESELKKWGLNIEIGEKGLNLSGGQRARATLARALLHSGELLILDDALSSIDAETEALILKELAKETRTLLSITHRVTALHKMDQIFVLHQGSLIEQGTMSQLLKKKTLFKTFYDLQQMENQL